MRFKDGVKDGSGVRKSGPKTRKGKAEIGSAKTREGGAGMKGAGEDGESRVEKGTVLVMRSRRQSGNDRADAKRRRVESGGD